jgi:putative phosphoesterase
MQPQLLLTAGVISDTHIPDRVDRIHPQIVPIFRDAHVDKILHGGDISIPSVLAELEQVAPVLAVRGNRDLIFDSSLPNLRLIDLAGVKVALMHGHGGWINYFRDKLVYFRDGYQLERYIPKLINTAPEARVIIFGHTHFPENFWRDGKLFFNPGSASSSVSRRLGPSVGILRFYSGGNVEGEIIKMTGLKIAYHQWVEDSLQKNGT